MMLRGGKRLTGKEALEDPAGADGGSVSSAGTTIRMIRANKNQALVEWKHEFEVQKVKLEDKIEDLQEDLAAATTPEETQGKEAELKKAQKLLGRLTRDYATKARMMEEAAEALEERTRAEREEEQHLRDLEEKVQDQKYRQVREWIGIAPSQIPAPGQNPAPHDGGIQLKIPASSRPPAPPRAPVQVNVPSDDDGTSSTSSIFESAAGGVDKDALLIQLMQTQLQIMQKPQGSYADKKLPEFNGDPGDWGNFNASYKRTQRKYKFEDSENMARFQAALKGKARESVKQLMSNVSNVNKIMEVLEKRFGRPEFVLDHLIERAKSCRKPELSKPETIVDFGTAVEDLVVNICAFQEDDYMNNKQLVVELVNKLPGTIQGKWYDWLSDDDKRKSNLRNFSTWLDKEVKAALLQIKPSTTSEKSEERRGGRNRREHGSFNASEGKEDEAKIGRKCACCGQPSHSLESCWSLNKKSLDDRWDIVRKAKVCFCCLKSGHGVATCPEAKVCKIDGCERMHHQLLHVNPSNKGQSREKKEKKTKAEEEAEVVDGTIGASSSIVKGLDGPLAVILVRLRGPKGVSRLVYALLDSGATRSLIEEDLAEELDLEGPSIVYKYRVPPGTVVQNRDAKRVNVEVSGKYARAKPFRMTDAVTVPKIGLSPYNIDVEAAKQRWPHLKRYKGPSIVNGNIQLVIGNDNGYLMLHKEHLLGDQSEPVGVRTALGWVITGKLSDVDAVGSSYGMTGVTDETLHQMIEDSFKLENYGSKDENGKSMSLEDKRALKMLEEGTKLKEKMRWEAPLLWKDDKPFPSSGYDEALASLQRAEKRMKRDPDFAKTYNEKFAEYKIKRYLRKLTPEEAAVVTPHTRYISHFGVTNPNKPGKFRLVFNAAEKADGVSLNDRLLTGPDLLQPLPSVLSNFRIHPVAISGDMEDMYHRVLVCEKDRCAQRLLWRNGESDRDPDIYEMVVLIFGAKPSQATAIYVKDCNASMYEKQFPQAVKVLKKNMFSDDLLVSVPTVPQAATLRDQVSGICGRGGFVFKKWISNDVAVMESIPESLRLHGEKAMTEEGDAERVLGLWWDPNADQFTFKLNFNKVNPAILEGKQPTKRQMTSLLMSLFDPLGFLGQYKIKGMMLVQRVWLSEVDWDDVIPEDIYSDWMQWISQLKELPNVKVPRWYGYSEKSTVELHCFVDASSEAFCAVTYLRVEQDGGVGVSFVASRVKVAPKKKLTIPRLELEAAVLGAKLVSKLLHEIDVDVTSCHFWTDSSTVLSWITSDSRRYKEFVANRVSKIQTLTSLNDWRWISTKDNVADDATRWNNKTDLRSESRWLRGPDFLLLSRDKWPNKTEVTGVVSALAVVEELGDAPGVGPSTDEGCGLGVGELSPENLPEIVPAMERFSNYYRLIRATAAVRAAAKYWIDRSRKVKGIAAPWTKPEDSAESNLKEEDLISAETTIIRVMQFQCQKEMKVYASKYKVHRDQFGVMRMIRRIGRASNVVEESKSPILLPKQHYFVELISDQAHRKNAHTGRMTVYNELRQRFWFPDGKQAVRRSWTRCGRCRIKRANPVLPEMGILPACRLDCFTPTFTYTGVDMFGPIEVTVGRRHEKRWGMIFCDMVTRGVHLEVTAGLSADDTMLAISRFVDTRGLPLHFYSYNGTNFQAVAKILRQREKYHRSTWHFIPPASPHMGGAWESLVKQVKKVLYNLLKEVHPPDQVLMTELKAVENIVNSRPLAYVSGDQEDPESLTPNHFLRGIGIAAGSIGNQGAVSSSATFGADIREENAKWGKQWEKAQALANEYWKRWTKEVLPGMLMRNKWTVEREPLKVGDIVLKVDEQQPRNQWTKAVVTKTFPGEEGAVRVVEISTRDFETKVVKRQKRAVAKLCPIGVRMDGVM